MTFLKNAWYAAAWADEIKDAFLARRILEEPVLMFRRENASAVALADRCPHRFVPLSMGRRHGDVVECVYHGLRFDGAGMCVHNPHGDAIAKALRVRTYPLVEKYRALWIWMGDPSRADPSRIPDFSFLNDDAHFTTVTATSRFDANYELITDNLLDLTHVSYLHTPSFGPTNIAQSEMEVRESGATVYCNRLCRNDLSRPPIRQALVSHEGAVDFWLDMRWDPPANLRFDIGVTPAGRPRSEGLHSLEPHLITPETATSAHYFWGDSRDYMRDDPGLSKRYIELLRVVFDGEDKTLIEAQQRLMGTPDLMSLGPVHLKCDGGAVRAREILSKLIAAQERAAKAG